MIQGWEGPVHQPPVSQVQSKQEILSRTKKNGKKKKENNEMTWTTGLSKLTSSDRVQENRTDKSQASKWLCEQGLTSHQTQHTWCCIWPFVQQALEVAHIQHSTSDLHNYSEGKQEAFLKKNKTETEKQNKTKKPMGISDLEFVKW